MGGSAFVSSVHQQGHVGHVRVLLTANARPCLLKPEMRQ
jgi:hypothetical protein